MIEATSVFDEKSLKLGSALHMRYRHPIFLGLRYFYLLLVPLGAYLLWRGDELFGYLFLMTGPVLFVRKYFWQYRLIKSAQNSPQAGEELHWSFGEEGIHQRSKFHDGELKWGIFCDRYLSPKAILLYPQRDQYLILPRTAFRSQEDFEEVSRLCGEKITVGVRGGRIDS